MTSHQYIQNFCWLLDVDWWLLVEFIPWVEVLQFIHRSNEILEAKHNKVLLAGFRIKFDLFFSLFLPFLWCGLPGISCTPLIHQGMLINFSFSLNESEHTSHPSNDPFGGPFKKAILDIMIGTARKILNSDWSCRFKNGRVTSKETITIIHQIIETFCIA